MIASRSMAASGWGTLSLPLVAALLLLPGCFGGREPLVDQGAAVPDRRVDQRPPTGACSARRVCEGGSCSDHFPGAETPCDDSDPCTHGDACDGQGSCRGTPLTCTADACVRRTCNGTATCSVTQRGTPVYETFLHGFHYSTQGSGLIAFRLPPDLGGKQKTAVYLRYAPAIANKMLSTIADESATCDWCACGKPCAFTQNVATFEVAAVQEPGMVPLNRFMGSPTEGVGDPPEFPGTLRFRGSALTFLAGWELGAVLTPAFVCLP